MLQQAIADLVAEAKRRPAILLSERDPDRIIAFAETIRRTLRAPITFNDREIFLTASIGIILNALWTDPVNTGITFGIILVGGPVDFVWRATRRGAP